MYKKKTVENRSVEDRIMILEIRLAGIIERNGLADDFTAANNETNENEFSEGK